MLQTHNEAFAVSHHSGVPNRNVPHGQAQALSGGGGIDRSVVGAPGRNPVDNDDTTRHLSGRSVRVLAFGLAFHL